MWGAIISALGRVIGWLLGASTVKWAITAVLLFGVTLLFDVILGLLPSWLNGDDLVSASSVFTPEIWYFIDYFQVQFGLSLILSAYVTRFLIRRIPGIG